jgi:hypothetical protein
MPATAKTLKARHGNALDSDCAVYWPIAAPTKKSGQNPVALLWLNFQQAPISHSTHDPALDSTKLPIELDATRRNPRIHFRSTWPLQIACNSLVSKETPKDGSGTQISFTNTVPKADKK